MNKVNKDFYLQDNVLHLAQALLGKILYTNIDGHICSGVIVETEAYKAPEDKASHAFGNKKTNRTSTFYLEGGVAYVYLCYGIHSLFNIVTNQADIPHAILVRAIAPVTGIDKMMERRGKSTLDNTLTRGPGAVAQALGITRIHNAISLVENTIWIKDNAVEQNITIASGSRIGVGYAEEYAYKPWRFWIADSKWVSGKKVR